MYIIGARRKYLISYHIERSLKLFLKLFVISDIFSIEATYQKTYRWKQNQSKPAAQSQSKIEMLPGSNLDDFGKHRPSCAFISSLVLESNRTNINIDAVDIVSAATGMPINWVLTSIRYLSTVQCIYIFEEN